MENVRTVKKPYECKPISTILGGRPWSKWENDVKGDLRIVKINNWKKTHPGKSKMESSSWECRDLNSDVVVPEEEEMSAPSLEARTFPSTKYKCTRRGRYNLHQFLSERCTGMVWDTWTCNTCDRDEKCIHNFNLEIWRNYATSEMWTCMGK